MDDFENELRLGFLEEARELLSNAEQCFLNLEKAKDDPQVIEEIFRLAHNIKGSAGAVGFQDLKEFTHKLESLLLRLKNKEIQIDKAMVSLLLKCNDHLCQSIDRLRQNPEADCTNPVLLRELDIKLDPAAGQVVIENDPWRQPELSADVASAPPATVSPAASSPHPQTAGATQAARGDETIRVNLSRIDNLLNNVGELVILQTVLSQQRLAVASALLQKTIGQMNKIVKEIQQTSMGLRMLPLKQTFQKMQRIVRDTSQALGKEATLHMSGEDIELDKTMLEQLSDPLVHLVRNAVDHGLETTDERRDQGKDPQGHIHLSAYHRGGKVLIEIRDDGKGLNPVTLRQKAVEKGLLRESDTLTDAQAYQLIFAPGFSTKTEVSDVSGRGVGMDVVKTNIAGLQGEIEIDTELGRGTCFRIALPLTLAIVDGMVVTQTDQRFVIPIAQVSESLRPKQEDVSFVNETGEVLVLRGESMPLFRLESLLGQRAERTHAAWEAIVLVVREAGSKSFAVAVDEIVCQQQVVIKQLGREIRELPGVSGAAILGDGRAGLILDLVELTHARLANKEAA
jgi:two-component system chemotaxis sensor kinase CheA